MDKGGSGQAESAVAQGARRTGRQSAYQSGQSLLCLLPFQEGRALELVASRAAEAGEFPHPRKPAAYSKSAAQDSWRKTLCSLAMVQTAIRTTGYSYRWLSCSFTRRGPLNCAWHRIRVAVVCSQIPAQGLLRSIQVLLAAVRARRTTAKLKAGLLVTGEKVPFEALLTIS